MRQWPADIGGHTAPRAAVAAPALRVAHDRLGGQCRTHSLAAGCPSPQRRFARKHSARNHGMGVSGWTGASGHGRIVCGRCDVSNTSSDNFSGGGSSSGSVATGLGGLAAAAAAPESGEVPDASISSVTVTVTAESTSTSAVDADEIARRIAASRARRAGPRLSYNCPACSISAATPANIARHVARCCPDLLTPDAEGWSRLETLPGGFPSPQHDTVVGLLRAAGRREQELRRRVLTCVFLSGPVDEETGLPSRLEAEEAARSLGLPLERASAVLQRAMASVPLASDAGGPPLDVVFEDEHFLAVNKPVGLHTAPIHRFTGGSVVNKVIAYLNRGRGRRPGGTPITLLTPPPGAGGAAGPPMYGSAIPELVPLPEPFSLTSTSTSSSSDDGSDCDAGGGPSRTVQYQLEPYVLHRLDMNTSGLLLFAKRPEVVAGMHRQFRERTLSKLYLAAAVGCPDDGDGCGPQFQVDAPIDRHPTQAVARRVADTGKEASTSFAVLASNAAADLGPAAGGAPGLLFHERPPSTTQHRGLPQQHRHQGAPGDGDSTTACTASTPAAIPRGASLLLCAPHTGRTHQIRVHLHHVGHPIVGDDIYGVTGPWLARQALHAAALRFTHPLTGRPVTLAAPLHDDMAAALAALGLPQPDAAALVQAEWPGGGSEGTRGGARSGGDRRRRHPRQ